MTAQLAGVEARRGFRTAAMAAATVLSASLMLRASSCKAQEREAQPSTEAAVTENEPPTAVVGEAAPSGAPSIPECITQHRTAQELRQEGRLLEASRHFKECLHPACSAPLRAECARVLDEVEAEIPSIVVAARSGQGDLLDVSVYDGDTLLTKRLDGRPIELDPGAHQLRFEAPRHSSVTHTVMLRVGERNRLLDVVLTPAVVAEPPRRTSRELPRRADNSDTRLNAFVFGGAASLAIAGGVFAWLARAEYKEAERSCAPVCSDARLQRIEVKSIAADVLFVLSAGTFGYGIVHVLSRKQSSQPQRSGSIRIGPGYVSAEGRF